MWGLKTVSSVALILLTTGHFAAASVIDSDIAVFVLRFCYPGAITQNLITSLLSLIFYREQSLDRRVTGGSCYVVMTPAVTQPGQATEANEVVYVSPIFYIRYVSNPHYSLIYKSFKRGEYLMYIKYGEGDDSRLKAYQTHNPTIV
jgi:hypothetical protein